MRLFLSATAVVREWWHHMLMNNSIVFFDELDQLLGFDK